MIEVVRTTDGSTGMVTGPMTDAGAWVKVTAPTAADIPLALAEGGFAIVCILTVAVCVALAVYLRRRRLL